ncbi:MAG TPA: hypothetical protein VIU62_21695 [Chloroflexota bacterium]
MPVSASSNRLDRLARALLAGFVGTTLAGAVALLAYVLASVLGPVISGTFGTWLMALTRNSATATVQDALAKALLVHLGVGIIWSLVYVFMFEFRLPGPGWQRGALFALGPWLLSLVVFLPLVGAGFLGLAIGAGPLPIIGNLILHLVYGATMGEMYALELAEGVELDGRPARPTTLANLAAERGLALGMVLAGILGAIVGIAISLFMGGSVPVSLGALAGLAFGASAGALVGSFIGLNPESTEAVGEQELRRP